MSRRLVKSIGAAVDGIGLVWRHEPNFRIHIFVFFLVLIAAYSLALPTLHIAMLCLTSSLVLILEVINTVFEHFLDSMKPRLTMQVKEIKDLMAGAVFLSAVGAIFVGILLFFPPIMLLFS